MQKDSFLLISTDRASFLSYSPLPNTLIMKDMTTDKCNSFLVVELKQADGTLIVWIIMQERL